MRAIDGLRRSVVEEILNPEQSAARQTSAAVLQRRYRAEVGDPLEGLGVMSWLATDSYASDDYWSSVTSEASDAVPVYGEFDTPFHLRCHDRSFSTAGPSPYSLLADYASRGTVKAVTLDTLAKREVKHVRNYRRRLRKAEKAYRDRRAQALEKFAQTRHNRLAALLWQITKTDAKRNRFAHELHLLVARMLRKQLKRYPTDNEVSAFIRSLEKGPMADNHLCYLVSRIADLTARTKALQAKMQEVMGWTFRYPDFHYAEYKPRWYDLVNHLAVQPCSLPYHQKFTIFNPVTHVKVRLTPITLTFTSQKDEWYNYGDEEWPWIETYKGVRSGTVRYGGAGYNIPAWARDTDALGPVEYNRQDVVKALKSMVPHPAKAGAASIPLFLVDLKSLPSMGTQLLQFASRIGSSGGRILRYALDGLWGATTAKGLRRTVGARDPNMVGRVLNEFFQAAKLFSGADLYRKFGAEPTVGFILDSTKVILQHVTNGDKKLLQFLRERGKELARQRTLHDSYDRWVTPLFNTAPHPGFTASIAFAQSAHYSEGWGWGDESETTDLYGDEAVTRFNNGGLRPSTFFGEMGYYSGGESSSVPQVEIITRKTQILSAYFSYDQSDALGWQLDDDEIRRRWTLDKLGLFCSASALWDAIPYSFLVNFLINVDQLVQYYDIPNIRPETTLYRLGISEKLDAVCRVLPGREFSRITDYGVFGHACLKGQVRTDGSIYARCKAYRREIIEVPQEELPGIKLRDLAFYKVLTAAELVLTKL